MVNQKYMRLKNMQLHMPDKNGAYRHRRLRQVKILAHWLAMNFHVPEKDARSGGKAVHRFVALLEKKN